MHKLVQGAPDERIYQLKYHSHPCSNTIFPPQVSAMVKEGVTYDCLIFFSTFIFLLLILIGWKLEMGAKGDSFCLSNTKAAKGKCPQHFHFETERFWLKPSLRCTFKYQNNLVLQDRLIFYEDYLNEEGLYVNVTRWTNVHKFLFICSIWICCYKTWNLVTI